MLKFGRKAAGVRGIPLCTEAGDPFRGRSVLGSRESIRRSCPNPLQAPGEKTPEACRSPEACKKSRRALAGAWRSASSRPRRRRRVRQGQRPGLDRNKRLVEAHSRRRRVAHTLPAARILRAAHRRSTGRNRQVRHNRDHRRRPAPQRCGRGFPESSSTGPGPSCRSDKPRCLRCRLKRMMRTARASANAPPPSVVLRAVAFMRSLLL
jgi:hypothetical protein